MALGDNYSDDQIHCLIFFKMQLRFVVYDLFGNKVNLSFLGIPTVTPDVLGVTNVPTI